MPLGGGRLKPEIGLYPSCSPPAVFPNGPGTEVAALYRY
jgi:hypothetical protein